MQRATRPSPVVAAIQRRRGSPWHHKPAGMGLSVTAAWRSDGRGHRRCAHRPDRRRHCHIGVAITQRSTPAVRRQTPTEEPASCRAAPTTAQRAHRHTLAASPSASEPPRGVRDWQIGGMPDLTGATSKEASTLVGDIAGQQPYSTGQWPHRGQLSGRIGWMPDGWNQETAADRRHLTVQRCMV